MSAEDSTPQSGVPLEHRTDLSAEQFACELITHFHPQERARLLETVTFGTKRYEKVLRYLFIHLRKQELQQMLVFLKNPDIAWHVGSFID